MTNKNSNISSFIETTETIEGMKVTISTPTKSEEDETAITGITFLLPGSNISVNEYNSHRDILVMKSQIVLSFYINVLWPMTNNHREKAEKVKQIFDTFHKTHVPHLPKSYSIVGHSVGGKIALLVAALNKNDDNPVLNVIALDPVDQAPSEFTNNNDNDNNANSNLSLSELSCQIIMTLTDGGGGISLDHDAHAIHEQNPSNTTLIRHEGAGHMAYTDHGGGMYGKLMPKGTPEADKAAWEGAHDLIRANIGNNVMSTAAEVNTRKKSLFVDDHEENDNDHGFELLVAHEGVHLASGATNNKFVVDDYTKMQTKRRILMWKLFEVTGLIVFIRLVICFGMSHGLF